MCPTRLNNDAGQKLDDLLDSEYNQKRSIVPAIFFGVTNEKEELYFNQKGLVHYGNPEEGQVQEDTILELYSATKFVTAIAALQLVQEGVVDLDSPEDVETYIPELGGIKRIQGYDKNDEAILVDTINRLTLRMLLSHTAGMGYPGQTFMLNYKWSVQNGRAGDSLWDPDRCTPERMAWPLCYEPGTAFSYGISVDYAGILVERASGMSLENYMRSRIFQPLGLESLTFLPTDQVRQKKMSCCDWDLEKGLRVTSSNGWGLGRPRDIADARRSRMGGGHGLFGNQRDYLSLLRAVLACGPKSEAEPVSRILSPESVRELFKSSLDVDQQDNRLLETLVEVVKNNLDKDATLENCQHSIAFSMCLRDKPRRRKAGSGSWRGAARTEFWLDPTTGIAGICATQQFAEFHNNPWYELYEKFEETVYAGLM